MIYLKEFANHNEYTAYTADTRNFLTPNTSLCQLEDDCHFTPMGPPDYSKDYLAFYAIGNGTFKFIGNSIDYSIDSGNTWVTLPSNTSTPTVSDGNKIMWRASGLTPNNDSGIGRFSSTVSFEVVGNVMSLVSGDSFSDAATVSDYQFCGLFSGCTRVKIASGLVLPATTLATNCYYAMFRGCTSLTDAPQLPATTLASGCYASMFQGCTSLTTAPELPATILANYCYQYMFSNCTRLTKVTSTLPATALVLDCYYSMFSGCTSLTNTPTLCGTTLGPRCYRSMFEGCTSLVTAPQIPDATINPMIYSCFYGMFRGCRSLKNVQNTLNIVGYTDSYAYMFADCTSLVTAPKISGLVAVGYNPENTFRGMFSGCTSLVNVPDIDVPNCGKGSFYAMFYGCTSLTTAPQICATTMAASACTYMFRGCTSLTTAPDLLAKELVSGCYNYMFYGCSSLNYIKALFTTTPSTAYTNNWVNGVATTGTFVKSLAASWDVSGVNGIPTNWNTEYHTTPIVPTTSFTTNNYITLESKQDKSIIIITKKSTNQTLYISEDHQNWAVVENFNNFKIDSGETLYVCGVLSGSNSDSDYTNMTISGKVSTSGSCNSLWNYENPAATLRSYCGYGLFSGSTGLLSAPELPATTLADSCYRYMFTNCTSLTTAPDLLATTLAQSCYSYMFSGCTSLTAAPALPATTLARYCYNSMFRDCTSLRTAPQLPAETLTNSCYAFMLQGCTSLTTAPALPATTLAYGCYGYMFYGCSSLTNAPSTLPATTLTTSCYAGMFESCTSLTTAPALPATTLKSDCYSYMFNGCSSLNYIKAMFTTIPSTTYTNSWVSGVAASGTFVKNSSAQWDVSGVNGIPNGWTIETASS